MISFTPAIDASWLGSWLYRSASLKATTKRNGTVVVKFLGYSYSCLRAPPREISTCRVMPLSLACVSSLTSAAARQIVIRNDMLGRTDCCLSPDICAFSKAFCPVHTCFCDTARSLYIATDPVVNFNHRSGLHTLKLNHTIYCDI